MLILASWLAIALIFIFTLRPIIRFLGSVLVALRGGTLSPSNIDNFSSPTFNLIVSALTLLSGLAIPVLPRVPQALLNIQKQVYDSWALGGAATLLLWIFCILVKLAAQKSKVEKDIDSLKQTILKLPEGFNFLMGRKTILTLTDLCRLARSSRSNEDSKKAIMACLEHVRQIASKFSGIDPSKIGINIMEAKKITKTTWNIHSKEVADFFADETIPNPGYFLVTRKDLHLPQNSQTKFNRLVLVSPPPNSTDKTSHELIIDGRWRKNVFPGAPLAFVNGEGLVYADTTTLPEELERDYNFRPATIEKLKKYFSGEGSYVRSFVSIRLGLVEPFFGVLNIDTSEPNVLGAFDDIQPTFWFMIHPILVELESLLIRISEEVKQVPRKRANNAS